MPIRQRLPRNVAGTSRELEAACQLVGTWGIRYELAVRLLRMAADLPYDVQIISGARTRAEQEELERRGRPAAPWDLSTHSNAFENGCPRFATGADLSPLVSDRGAPMVRAHLGAAAAFAGLRWGGGSPVGEDGIPSDWQHVDLGPRSTHP